MIVTADVLKNETVSVSDAGYRAERTFLVSSIPGNKEAKLYNALQASDIPKHGDPHPVIPGIVVTKVEAKPQTSGNQTRIVAVYTEPSSDLAAREDSSGQVVLSTGLVGEEEFFDIHGVRMSVRYLSGAIDLTKYATVDVQRPQIRAVFRRSELVSPKPKITQYLGKVNSTTWSGYPARTWLCSGINATETSSGYDVEYSFSHREETWRVEVIFRTAEEELAQSPINKESGNGYSTYEVYESADFNGLGLSF